MIIIAGAGPTGLMLACELRKAGVSVQLVDRADKRGRASRAAAIHPRTMELLDQRGVIDEFLAIGQPMLGAHFAGIGLDLSTLPTRYPYMLGIMQTATEMILERFAERLGVRTQWSTELVGVHQDDDAVTITLRGPDGTIARRADYVIGCDGASSVVRRLAGIPFDGSNGELVTVLGDVELDEPPAGWLMCDRRPAGTLTILPFGGLTGRSWWRIMVTEYAAKPLREPVTFDRLRESTLRVADTDFGMRDPHWLSWFADAERQATRYRRGRVMLAGDAAHVHPPLGGQGMNLGIQDAVNLGWKLAAVLHGHASQRLLDTYHEERHPVAARVLENTRAQTALVGAGENVTAMRAQLRSLLDGEQANEQLAAAMTGMDICYPSTATHPLAGRRLPNAEIRTTAGIRHLFPLLGSMRPVLLDFDARTQRSTAVPETVEYISARSAVRQWRLPALGWIPVPSALLIRPDGYVAWASTDESDSGLSQAVLQLFGR